MQINTTCIQYTMHPIHMLTAGVTVCGFPSKNCGEKIQSEAAGGGGSRLALGMAIVQFWNKYVLGIRCHLSLFLGGLFPAASHIPDFVLHILLGSMLTCQGSSMKGRLAGLDFRKPLVRRMQRALELRRRRSARTSPRPVTFPGQQNLGKQLAAPCASKCW